MIKEFDKLLKEKGKPLSSESAKVMKDSLHGLNEMIKDGLGKDMEGLKKITVASNSTEGIKQGLDAAKEKVEEASTKKEGESSEHEKEESPEHEKSESSTEENVEEKVAQDMSSLSEEEKIAFLEKQLEELKSKKKNSELASAKDSIKSIF